LEEHLLHHVLGVGGMAQDAPGNGEHRRPVLAHQSLPVGHVGPPWSGLPPQPRSSLPATNYTAADWEDRKEGLAHFGPSREAEGPEEGAVPVPLPRRGKRRRARPRGLARPRPRGTTSCGWRRPP